MAAATEIPRIRLIENIEGVIESTNKNVSICVSGKNTIIVGANGSGKTSFLRGIFNALKANIIDEHLFNKELYQANMKTAGDLLAAQPDNPNRSSFQQSFDHHKKLLDGLITPFPLEVS